MTAIGRHAQAAQAAARQKDGEFGSQQHTDPGLVEIPSDIPGRSWLPQAGMSPSVAPEPRMVLEAVKPGDVGTVFRALPAPDDHECKAACWRRNKKDGSIGTMCEYGHSVGRHDGKRGYGGSAFEASLGYLPAFAPFNLVEATMGN